MRWTLLGVSLLVTALAIVLWTAQVGSLHLTGPGWVRDAGRWLLLAVVIGILGVAPPWTCHRLHKTLGPSRVGCWTPGGVAVALLVWNAGGLALLNREMVPITPAMLRERIQWFCAAYGPGDRGRTRPGEPSALVSPVSGSLAQALDSVRAALADQLTSAEEERLADRVVADLVSRTGLTPEERDKKRRFLDIPAKTAARERADRWLRMAAEIVRADDPRLSDYDAKRRVLALYHSRFPGSPRVVFLPEPRLVPVPGVPPAPAAGARWASLERCGPAYWEDPAYVQLERMSPGELPDDAMLPLCGLAGRPAEELRRGGGPGQPVDVLLERYGVRLYPAVHHFLSQGRPENQETTRTLCHVARTWPEPTRSTFLRAVLRSGWNSGVAGGLPGLGPDLTAEFRDSPYGAP